VVLRFTVQDTGIGIPAEKQQAIFEPFTQADGSTTRKYGGTGLGLTICSRLVNMMGGRLLLQSRPGAGSTFSFTARFRLAQTPSGSIITLPPVRLEGLPALVVDDNETNRRILEGILGRWGMQPSSAASAPEALKILERAAAEGAPYRLVLLDAMMPEVDGFDLAAQIHQQPALAQATTVMMLSSAGHRGDAARCRELGISVYLVKPVRQAELLSAVLTALGRRQARQEPAPPVTRHSLREGQRGLRILVAEDNPVNQTLAVRLLEKQGHTAAVAGNGREALAALEREPFDLLLLDVQMPEMGGYETIRVIRDRERRTGSHLPVIALTAHAMKGDRERCLDAGMDDYLSKPVQAKELQRMIEKFFPVRPAASALNAKSLLARVEGDEQLLQELTGGTPE
jgi:CheY-like chemotaxis protein